MFVGLRRAGIGLWLEVLYPIPIAGGDPEAALEMVVAGMVRRLVEDVTGMGGERYAICVKLSG